MPDASQQFVVDSHGAVLNRDEQAWLKYKAERDNIIAIKELQKQVAFLMTKIQQLEERLK